MMTNHPYEKKNFILLAYFLFLFSLKSCSNADGYKQVADNEIDFLKKGNAIEHPDLYPLLPLDEEVNQVAPEINKKNPEIPTPLPYDKASPLPPLDEKVNQVAPEINKENPEIPTPLPYDKASPSPPPSTPSLSDENIIPLKTNDKSSSKKIKNLKIAFDKFKSIVNLDTYPDLKNSSQSLEKILNSSITDEQKSNEIRGVSDKIREQIKKIVNTHENSIVEFNSKHGTKTKFRHLEIKSLFPYEVNCCRYKDDISNKLNYLRIIANYSSNELAKKIFSSTKDVFDKFYEKSSDSNLSNSPLEILIWGLDEEKKRDELGFSFINKEVSEKLNQLNFQIYLDAYKIAIGHINEALRYIIGNSPLRWNSPLINREMDFSGIKAFIDDFPIDLDEEKFLAIFFSQHKDLNKEDLQEIDKYEFLFKLINKLLLHAICTTKGFYYSITLPTIMRLCEAL